MQKNSIITITAACALLVLSAACPVRSASRPEDIPFEKHTIDLVVNEDPALQATFREGLPRLDAISASRFNGNTFLQLTESQQIEILTALSEATGQDGAFFHSLKNLTADGYYTSRIGLIQELGYNGDAVLTAFPESTIPEH